MALRGGAPFFPPAAVGREVRVWEEVTGKSGRFEDMMFNGLNSLDEVGVFLRVSSLEASRGLEVSGRERSGRVIHETGEGAKNK